MATDLARYVKNAFMASVGAYLVLVLAVFCVFANVFHNEFLYDDDLLITGNQFLRHWQNLPTLFTTVLTSGSNTEGHYYRPLQSLLYLFVFQAAGLSIFAYHLLNVSLHAVNACLLYRLGQKVRFTSVAVFLAVLVWAVHPLQTEAVTYMSATADTLSVLFIVLGLLVLLPDFSTRRCFASVPLVICALLSKETAIVFPLLAGCCLFFVREDRYRWRSYVSIWPVALVVALYSGVRLTLAGAEHHASVAMPSGASASYTPFATLPLYVKLMLWPSGLHMEHDLPVYTSIIHWPVLAGMVLIIVAAAQILKPQTPQSLPFSWGLLWFVAALVPVFDTDNIAYEHWLYLASAGLFLGVAQSMAMYTEGKFLFREKSAKYMGYAAYGVLLAVLGLLTCQQNKIWQDPATLFSNSIASGEPAIKAHANLGSYYSRHGVYDKAMDEYALAVKNSGDSLAAVQHNMGVTLMMADSGKMPEDALTHFTRALAIDPAYYLTLQLLSNFYAAAGNQSEADLYRVKADASRQNYKTLPETTAQP